MSTDIQFDSPESKPAPQPQVPQWVGIMIALLLVSSMLAAGGYWIWARATQPPRDQLVEVQGLPQMRGMIAAPPPANVRRTTGANNQVSYQVIAPDAVLTANKAGADPDWTLAFRYNRSDLMTPDQSAAITARFRLTIDPAYAKSLKVTEDQIKKLKEIPAGTPMIVGDADQKKMKAAINLYNNAPKPDAEPALIKALSEISAASLVTTRAAIAERTKTIQAILTAEQIAQFKN